MNIEHRTSNSPQVYPPLEGEQALVRLRWIECRMGKDEEPDIVGRSSFNQQIVE